MNRKIVLAFGLLLIAVLACNTPQTTQPQPPPLPPTVTPFVPATEEQPSATPTTEAVVQPTIEPTQTMQPPATTAATVTPTTQPTTPPSRTPAAPPSAGPLDFRVPEWIDGYDALPDGRYRVYVTIHISGGAPPFTVRQEGQVVAESWQRDVQFNFERGGCAAIVYTVIVNSADGQSVSHDYWIGTDKQPWCNP